MEIWYTLSLELSIFGQLSCKKTFCYSCFKILMQFFCMLAAFLLSKRKIVLQSGLGFFINLLIFFYFLVDGIFVTITPIICPIHDYVIRLLIKVSWKIISSDFVLGRKFVSFYFLFHESLTFFNPGIMNSSTLRLFPFSLFYSGSHSDGFGITL